MTKWKQLIEKSDLNSYVKEMIDRAVLYELDFGEEKKTINEDTKHLNAYLYLKKDALPLLPYNATYFTKSGNTTLTINITSYKTKVKK